MAEYVDFHYTPLEGRITGKQVLKQTEDAINDLGNRVYEAEVTSEDVQEALDNSQQAIDIAEDALAAVTTDKAVWFNNVADMKAANLVNGNVAATKGYTLYNDGNGAFYAIRQKKGGDVDDGVNIIFLDNGSVAERINEFNLIAKKNIIYVVNVAELKASDGKIGSVYGTLGYYTANDGGTGIYTIRAMTASDEEDGGSVIFLANGNVAELIVTGEININQFGGKGDGTTDDNVAIVNAVAYASKKNCRLVFLEGYTYYSSQPIVIENPPTEIRMDGALYYTGSGTALTIGSSSAAIENRVLKLNVVGSETHTAESKGVILYNFNNSQIYLYKVQYFGDTAVTYCGNTKGFAYNTTVIGKVFSAPVCLKLTNIGSGWCNENKFYGGRFGTYSQDTFRSSAIGILITSDSDNYSQNANIFYSPSLEIATGVKIERGQYNFFYDCRTEGSVYPILTTGAGSNSVYNFMSSSYGYYGYSASSGNIYNDGNHLLEEKLLNNVIFDSGIIADNLASDGTRVGFAKLIHIAGNSTTTDKYIRNSYFSIVDGKLNITNGAANGNIGAIIDTTKNKMVYAQFVASGTGRRVVAMWDADGNIITDEAPIYLSLNGHALGALSLISGRQFYQVGNNVSNSNKMLIILPDKCAKAFIGIGGTDIIFERMIITGAYPATYESLQNYETAVLSTIPTSVGKVGQFVKKTTPTQGEIGWVYDGTQWLAVG